jgi:hypothetical protein
MEALAVWYEKQKDDGSSTAAASKININIWKGTDSVPYYLDFGILLYNCRQVKTLYIYISQKVKQGDITDLGKRMVNDPRLIETIFNARITDLNTRQNHTNDEKYVAIHNEKTENVLFVSVDGSTYFSAQETISGTILSIAVHELIYGDIENVYFRFRFKLTQESGPEMKNMNLSITEKPRFWYFQSAFYSTETLGLRINDRRFLPRNICERIDANILCPLEKVHLFLMRDLKDLLVDKSECSIRLLEEEIWEKYTDGMELLKAGKKHIKQNLVAYHYKSSNQEEKACDNYSFFCRIQYSDPHTRLILLYSLTVIGLAVLGNFLTDLLKFLFKTIF